VIGQSVPHESGLKHATGQARYVDDASSPQGLLVAQILTSPVARARLKRVDATKASQVPGVVCILTARDIPGENNVGPVVHDEELLASHEVHYLGQAIALIVGESYAACRAGVAAMALDFETLPAIVTLDEAIAKKSWLSQGHFLRRGEIDRALSAAAFRFSGEVRTGGQDHFYLETQCALALPDEDSVRVISSTQHPSEVQALVAHTLHWPRSRVVVEVPRMGGGFGGKETQAAPYACLAALAAVTTQRPVKVWLNRDQDMQMTGKRHPFVTQFDVGFDAQGMLLGLKAQLTSDGGCSLDLSKAILDRALFHIDNAYFIPHLEIQGCVAKTNTPSNTAFRGFGGPQGMAVIEDIFSRASERFGFEPSGLRQQNFYGSAPRHVTPFWQPVTDFRLNRIFDELKVSSQYQLRRALIDAENQSDQFIKRGLAITPVKFGISFTTAFLNQAGALVHVYSDGTIQVNHGGTEMGQGLHTKMLQLVCHEFGLSPNCVRIMTTATDKVPNTSATAASSGSDLNGQAVKNACEILKSRLLPIAARLLGCAATEVCYAHDAVKSDTSALPFAQVVREAYLAQISLSATGYYRTPDICFDKETGRGKPFHYFAYGAAVTEVGVNGLTGEHRLLRVDILHDVGASLSPGIDRGQIEGGFMQGWGWLTCEELVTDAKGFLKTHSPDTYKIPAFGDAPQDFRVNLLSSAPQPDVIYGSKAVGEPPLMLALSAVAALRHAIGAFGPSGFEVQLSIPCTPEAVLWAIEAQKKNQSSR
jgi:xanthine dehydrogenase large subunit